MTNFRLFQFEEFADDNLKFDENGRKLSKRLENTVGKGEIARYEQFLLFPVFSKGLFPRSVKSCHCVGMGYLLQAFEAIHDKYLLKLCKNQSRMS